MRQNFDQSWQRWKARQAEERALVEMDNLQLLEQEQLRLFGGDVGEDELFRLGILYTEDGDITFDSEPNNIECDVPVQIVPTFIIRHARKPRRSRRSRWRTLPLHLSFSGLSNDADILRLLSPSPSPEPTIQHHILPTIHDIDIPQSLPAPLALISPGSSISSLLTVSHLLNHDTPPSSLPDENDWTLIPLPPTQHTHDTSPISNPDPWILIDDS
jgi:hypothetical protein